MFQMEQASRPGGQPAGRAAGLEQPSRPGGRTGCPGSRPGTAKQQLAGQGGQEASRPADQLVAPFYVKH